MNYPRRLRQLRQRLRRSNAVALLVTHLPNVRYLCGFSGSAGVLLVTPERSLLFTDNRYREQSAQEVREAEVVIPETGGVRPLLLAEMARLKGVIAFEAEHLSVALQEELFARRRGLAVRGWVERLRERKEPEEVAAIRRAVRLASRAFPRAVAHLRPGMSERGFAARLEYELRASGAEGLSFETIVASGWHGAHVHGRASQKAIEKGELVVIDYGVLLSGYVSDMTRTLHVGTPDRRTRAVYRAVLEAQLAAIAAVRPGVRCGEVDAAARNVLAKAGLGQYFQHSTGHGVGLEIHEAPRIAAQAKEKLQAGQVITIEPGVYIPGWGGVRIEDVVAVTERGAEVLTPTPKRLLHI